MNFSFIFLKVHQAKLPQTIEGDKLAFVFSYTILGQFGDRYP
jgi:hypothetical protein